MSFSSLTGYSVALTPVTQEDIERLRVWRNSAEVREFMVNQSLISREQQQAWYNKLQRDNTQRHYMIRYKNVPIGSINIRCVHNGCNVNDADIIEPGLFIGEQKFRGNIVAFAPSLLINDLCFLELQCKQLQAKVKTSNRKAISYNQHLGYKIKDCGEYTLMTLAFNDYIEATSGIKALLSRNRNN